MIINILLHMKGIICKKTPNFSLILFPQEPLFGFDELCLKQDAELIPVFLLTLTFNV